MIAGLTVLVCQCLPWALAESLLFCRVSAVQDFQHEMLIAVEAAYDKKQPPFASTELCERVFHGIKCVAGSTQLSLVCADLASSCLSRTLTMCDLLRAGTALAAPTPTSVVRRPRVARLTRDSGQVQPSPCERSSERPGTPLAQPAALPAGLSAR